MSCDEKEKPSQICYEETMHNDRDLIIESLAVEDPLKVDLKFQTVKIEQCQVENPEGKESWDPLQFQDILNDTKVKIKLENFESLDYGTDISEILVKSEHENMNCGDEELMIKNEDEDDIDMVGIKTRRPQIIPQVKPPKLKDVCGNFFPHQSTYGANVQDQDLLKDSSHAKEFNECDYKGKHKINLNAHRVLHKIPLQVDTFKCNESRFESNFKSLRHMLGHKDLLPMEKFKCNECSFETKHKKNLKGHLLTHKDSSQVKVFKCNECSFQSKFVSYLKRHVLVHTQVKSFKCNKCIFESKHKRSLERHMLLHKDPSKIEVFKCSECRFESKFESYLKRHILVHTHVKKFKCNECIFESKHKQSLKVHMLVHKDTSQVKMFKCNKCYFQCKHRSGLKQHMLIHKDPSQVQMFKCTECSYQSKRKNHLKGHMLIHQKYKC